MLSPQVLEVLATLEADDVEDDDLDGAAGGRYAQELAGVAPQDPLAAGDPVAVGGTTALFSSAMVGMRGA